MRDQDAGDCVQIKNHLAGMVANSNKQQNTVIIRIACRELESFYLGDLAAVERGLGMPGIAKQQNKSKYRRPDSLANPSIELAKLAKNQYQKIAGSRAIAPHLKVDGSNSSHSFKVLLNGIQTLIGCA